MNRRPVNRPWRTDGVGEKRTPIAVTYRPTAEQFAQVATVAKAYGMSVEQLLTRALKLGVERTLQDARESGIDIGGGESP